jgi:hypothetical protein
MRATTRILVIGVLLSGAVSRVSADASDRPQVWSVNCHAGQSIARGGAARCPGDTIVCDRHMPGACGHHPVGQPAGTRNGRTSTKRSGTDTGDTIRARRRHCRLTARRESRSRGLTVRKRSKQRNRCHTRAAVMAKDVIAERQLRSWGISVSDNSILEAVDSVTRSNGVSGFDVFTSSSLILSGSFTTSDNGGSGGEIQRAVDRRTAWRAGHDRE